MLSNAHGDQSVFNPNPASVARVTLESTNHAPSASDAFASTKENDPAETQVHRSLSPSSSCDPLLARKALGRASSAPPDASVRKVSQSFDHCSAYLCKKTRSCSIPTYVLCNARRRAARAKARAHYTRDRNLRPSPLTREEILAAMNYAATSCPLPAAFAASRNQSTFIKDEELKPQLEDRVGTPHPSELSSADDIGTQPQAEKLNSSPGVGGLEGMENSIRPEQHEELEVVEKTWLPPGKDSFQFVDAKGEDMMAKGVIAFDVPGSY